jgi:hypothetical protein
MVQQANNTRQYSKRSYRTILQQEINWRLIQELGGLQTIG